VMATHGRTGLARMLVGSVARQVIARSPLPVLVQRPRDLA
jgi:nucleotide-binding universal stress UspA family protein